MIACIHTHVEAIGSKWWCQRRLMNVARPIGSIHNERKQEFQEQYVAHDFRNTEWYFKEICEIHESSGDERILDKCEKLSVGVFRWQRTARQ